jgi:hypothetical protein
MRSHSQTQSKSNSSSTLLVRPTDSSTSKKRKSITTGVTVECVAAGKLTPSVCRSQEYSCSPNLRDSATDSSFFHSARTNNVIKPERPPHYVPNSTKAKVEALEETVPLVDHQPPPISSEKEKECLDEDTWPDIWAESRQELCESLQWFRSYQSGVYFSQGHVKGYLLGAFSARYHALGHMFIRGRDSDCPIQSRHLGE